MSTNYLGLVKPLRQLYHCHSEHECPEDQCKRLSDLLKTHVAGKWLETMASKAREFFALPHCFSYLCSFPWNSQNNLRYTRTWFWCYVSDLAKFASMFSSVQLETELSMKVNLKLFAILHNSPSTGVFCHNLFSISLKGWNIYEKLLVPLKEELLFEIISSQHFRCMSPYPNGLCKSTCWWQSKKQLAVNYKCKILKVTRSYYRMPV